MWKQVPCNGRLSVTGYGLNQEIKCNRISAETEHVIFILLEYKV